MVSLETNRLILREINEGDINDIFEYSHNPNVGPRAGWEPHKDLDDTEAVMKEVFIGKENVWGITLKESGKLIGSIGLTVDPKRNHERTRMFGYAMGEAYWGKGLMTEAAREVIRYGFEELKLDLISSYCFEFNDASRNVIKKNGLKYEGRLKCAEIRFDGEVFDHLLFSITREEYSLG